MGLADIFSHIVVYGLLAGFGIALVDMLVRIHKQPRQPIKWYRLSPYPFVPDEEPETPRLKPRSGDLRLKPVPIEIRRQGH